MNTQDNLAWKREFEHVEEKQKQREGWELKEGKNNHDFELGVAVTALAALADLATER